MNISLLDLNSLYLKISREDFKNVLSVIEKMCVENINLTGWVLVEIPEEQTYCFYNSEKQEAFDFEEKTNKELSPHYYKNIEGDIINKFAVSSIKEAIKKYELN
ncbi:hypothetical protein KGN15_009655 [Lactococcus lactis]|uniref:hypothetical protein n=1 Tax=Lactococcus lactis TaxID=1358 RepID=UPI001C1F9E3F|nr:hypothetical protein [Lactococcus lactis]MBU7533020.1 hypothetical protein [Lactococcus lactis]